MGSAWTENAKSASYQEVFFLKSCQRQLRVNSKAGDDCYRFNNNKKKYNLLLQEYKKQTKEYKEGKLSGALFAHKTGLPCLRHVSGVACHLWHVTFYVPPVMCQVSHVTCHCLDKKKYIYKNYKVVELACGGSVINGANSV